MRAAGGSSNFKHCTVYDILPWRKMPETMLGVVSVETLNRANT